MAAFCSAACGSGASTRESAHGPASTATDDLCEQQRVALAGAKAVTLSASTTTAGGAASDLQAAGISPNPWAALPPSQPVAGCTYSIIPVPYGQSPQFFLVDAYGHSSRRPSPSLPGGTVPPGLLTP